MAKRKHIPNKDGVGGFTAGKSGNPNGRPRKELCISDLLRIELQRLRKFPVDRKNPRGAQYETTYLRLLVESQLKRAINGDSQAARNVWERIEGKPVQPISVDPGISTDAPVIINMGSVTIEYENDDDSDSYDDG